MNKIFLETFNYLNESNNNKDIHYYHVSKYNESLVKQYPKHDIEIELKEPINIPDGEYYGIQSGYCIEIPKLDLMFDKGNHIKTANGVRGKNISVKLKIKNDKVFMVYYKATQDQMLEVEKIS